MTPVMRKLGSVCVTIPITCSGIASSDTPLLRQTYQRNFREHQRELEASFHILRGEFATFTTEKPLIETLTTFLRRRVLV